MAISLTEDFKTIEELQKETEAILSRVRTTRHPVSITMDGKPAVVLLEVGTFERLLRTPNLVRLVGPAEEDILAGRTRPFDDFMKEFCDANQIPLAGDRGASTGHSGNSRLHRQGQKKKPPQSGSVTCAER